MPAPSRQDAAAPGRMPVVARYDVALPAAECKRLEGIATEIREEDGDPSVIPPLDPQLATGLLPGAPALLVEDHSEILYAHERGSDVTYTYRSLVLATDGDMLAVYGPRVPAFESYCRDFLGIGRVEILSPAGARNHRSPCMLCAEDGAFVERVAAGARRAGGLNVMPYMATGGAWCLAGRIAQRARVPVRVAGPPPRLARLVNDKIWFARRAREVLGHGSVPPSDAVYGVVGLVGHLRRLARHSGAVALKLTHGAASSGNLVFDSAWVNALAPVTLRDRLLEAMRSSGWQENFPIQVAAWEAPLVGSPSVQLWIPALGSGGPIVEGVFDQAVSGRLGRFSGAVPSALPERWRKRIARESVQLATLFQHLGYFGRCSFDSVVFGRDLAGAELHWVECNGRWGGVSIPMTLANRLAVGWSRGGFVIVSRRDKALRVRDTADFLARFERELYRPGAAPAGVILLCPGRLEARSGIDMLVLAPDAADAGERSERILDRLTGSTPTGPEHHTHVTAV